MSATLNRSKEELFRAVERFQGTLAFAMNCCETARREILAAKRDIAIEMKSYQAALREAEHVDTD